MVYNVSLKGQIISRQCKSHPDNMDKIAKKFSMQRKVGLSENQPKKHKNAVYSKSSTFTNLGDECTHLYHKKKHFSLLEDFMS